MKQRQKETVSTWLYEEYRRLWIEKGQEPHKQNNREIVAAVMEQIEAAGIWLPEQEVTKYFYRRKPHYRSRIEKELQPKPKMQDKDSQTQKNRVQEASNDLPHPCSFIGTDFKCYAVEPRFQGKRYSVSPMPVSRHLCPVNQGFFALIA